MPDARTEIAQLRAENKKLKALLKNAVRLLHQSKEFLQHPGKQAAPKRGKKTAKRPAKSAAAPARGTARN